MLVFFPVGVEGTRHTKVPWACILLAVAATVVFVLTRSSLAEDAARQRGALAEVLTYWQERPYLEPSPAFVDSLEIAGLSESMRSAGSAARLAGQVPSPAELAREQQALNRHCDHYLAVRRQALVWQWGWAPDRGVLQWGALTYVFVHSGWLHLLTNLFFLYWAGPVLEERLGALGLLGFFVFGGVAAGAMEASIASSSTQPIVGASGAIAFLFGMFTVWYARRRVRVAYWLVFWVGFALIPAYWWAGAWVARELALFALLGRNANIAFVAHLAGFGAGAALAWVLRAVGPAKWRPSEPAR